MHTPPLRQFQYSRPTPSFLLQALLPVPRAEIQAAEKLSPVLSP